MVYLVYVVLGGLIYGFVCWVGYTKTADKR